MTEQLQNNTIYESEKTLELCEIIENAWSDEDLPQEEIEKILNNDK